MYKKKKSIIPIAIVIVLILAVSYLVQDPRVSEIIITLISIIGVLAVFLQLRQGTLISKGEFILNLEQKYSDSEAMCRIGNKLFNCEKFDISDRMDIISYLTFFETIYLLIGRKAISIEDVDELFRRRFFKAVMNKQIQEIELVTFSYGYTNIYCLYDLWMNLLRKKRQEHSVDVHGISLEVACPNYEFRLQRALKYDVVICREEGIAEFVSLIECIEERKDKRIFVAFGEKEVRNGLRNSKSQIILIKVGKETVAGGMLWFPDSSDADGDGKNIGLPNGSYAQIDNTVVREDYRGHGMQTVLINLSCRLAFEAGVNTVLATVSDNNPYSYINFEKSYFDYVTDIKFREADRRLYRRDLFKVESGVNKETVL